MYENFVHNFDIYQSIALNKDKSKKLSDDIKKNYFSR